MKELMNFINKILIFNHSAKNPDFDSQKQKTIFDEIVVYNQNICDPYYICENKFILSIFNISWQTENSEFLDTLEFYLLGLYVFGTINFEIFRANLQEFAMLEDFSYDMIVIAFLLHLEVAENHLATSVNFLNFLLFCRELGIASIFYNHYIELIRKYFPDYEASSEETSIGREVDRFVKNIRTRREYIKELATIISPETLKYLDFYLDKEVLNELSYHLYQKLSSTIALEKKHSIAEFQKKLERRFEEKGFPQVPAVVEPILAPHLKNLEARAVNMEDLANIPKEQIREFASLKAYSSPSLAQKVKIIFLGGGKIGNMGIIIQHKNNAILLDFGMSVANNSLPRWHPSLEFVKAVLVTHAHLDHTGGLPFLFSGKNSKRRWYGNPSTKVLTEKLLFNTSTILKERLSKNINLHSELKQYLNHSNLVNLFNSFHPLKPHKTVEVSPGFSITPYPASHLFGSYGYEIEVYGRRILFTGDFSLEKSELFQGAKFPTDADITIFDGTYYNREIPPDHPDTVILQAVENSSRLIIPAFSVGRTQKMIRKLEKLRVTQKKKVIVTGLAGEISKLMSITGNYDIKKNFIPEDFTEGTIVISGHGMVQSGTARTLLEATKEDSQTAVLLCGYQAPNTLGHALKNSHPIAKQIYKQKVFVAPLSGHSRPENLNEFIGELKKKKVMVHTPEILKILPEHKDIQVPEYLESIDI
ncbi:MAG: MBL fold metallo-hydrolase [Candidatus Heimdallarchaeaceae archaeon]